MTLRTLLILSYLLVIGLLSMGMGLLMDQGLSRLAREGERTARDAVEEVALETSRLSERLLTQQAESAVRRRVELAARQLALLLGGRAELDADNLASSPDARSIAVQEIRTGEGIVAGSTMVYDAELRPVLGGTGRASDGARGSSARRDILRRALENGPGQAVSDYFEPQAVGGRRQHFLAAAVVNEEDLVLAAEVDTFVYFQPLEEKIRAASERVGRTTSSTIRSTVELSRQRLQVFLVVGGGVLVLLAILFVFRFTAAVLRPLNRVRRGVHRVAEGDFDAQVPVAGTREVRELARTFNRLGRQLRRNLEELRRQVAARETVEGELRVAGQIQRAMLPEERPGGLAGEPFDLAGLNRATEQVGGDLYDYFRLEDGRVALVIGDVSGKGVPAALFMALTRMVLRISARQCPTPHEAMEMANRLIHMDNRTNLYVTVVLAFYEPTTGRCVFSNAGHVPPAVVRRNRQVRWLEQPHGTVVGAVEERTYPTGSFELAPGELLLLCTDGVTEAHAEGGDMYGHERLAELLRGMTPADLEARSVCERIVERVMAYQVGHQHDDITLLALRREG